MKPKAMNNTVTVLPRHSSMTFFFFFKSVYGVHTSNFPNLGNLQMSFIVLSG